jgi:hypothetical protein
MRPTFLLTLSALAAAALSIPAQAGEVTLSAKNPPPPPLPIEDYIGGRGLLTIQGPTGLFINPTSGTMPAGAFTAQYCFFLPNNDADPVMAHGALLSYGVTDWLEVGGLFGAKDVDGGGDLFSGGPMVRVRILKDEGPMPELSVGGYAFLGDEENYNAFIALFKRVEISQDGFLRSVGFHAGLRETWIEKPTDDPSETPVGYFGLEVELPLRFYLVGEVSTKDEDLSDETPYAFGVQWRLGGINISAAFTEPGLGFVDEPSFFFGIGTQLSF